MKKRVILSSQHYFIYKVWEKVLVQRSDQSLQCHQVF